MFDSFLVELHLFSQLDVGGSRLVVPVKLYTNLIYFFGTSYSPTFNI